MGGRAWGCGVIRWVVSVVAVGYCGHMRRTCGLGFICFAFASFWPIGNPSLRLLRPLMSLSSLLLSQETFPSVIESLGGGGGLVRFGSVTSSFFGDGVMADFFVVLKRHLGYIFSIDHRDKARLRSHRLRVRIRNGESVCVCVCVCVCERNGGTGVGVWWDKVGCECGGGSVLWAHVENVSARFHLFCTRILLEDRESIVTVAASTNGTVVAAIVTGDFPQCRSVIGVTRATGVTGVTRSAPLHMRPTAPSRTSHTHV